MTQHVSHYHSDQIRELRAEIERLEEQIAALQTGFTEAHLEIERLRGIDTAKLQAENERLRALLQEAIRLTMSAEHNKISPPKWVIEARRTLDLKP